MVQHLTRPLMLQLIDVGNFTNAKTNVETTLHDIGARVASICEQVTDVKQLVQKHSVLRLMRNYPHQKSWYFKIKIEE